MTELWSWLDEAVSVGASDLHLSPGSPPAIRRHGTLACLDAPPLDARTIWTLVTAALDEVQRRALDEQVALEVALHRNSTRVRARLLLTDIGLSAVFRVLPRSLPAVDGLGLDPAIYDLSQRRGGLVILAGTRGSGRSTTAHALLSHLYTDHAENIVSIEAPVEYVHSGGRGVISQRRVGVDAPSHRDALEAVASSVAHVVYVDGVYDGSGLAAALELATAGRWVLVSLFAPDVRTALTKVLDAPPGGRAHTAPRLSRHLRAVFAQRLVPTLADTRIAVVEQLIASEAVREGLERLATTSPTDRLSIPALNAQPSFDDALASALAAGTISGAVAADHATDRHRFAP